MKTWTRDELVDIGYAAVQQAGPANELRDHHDKEGWCNLANDVLLGAECIMNREREEGDTEIVASAMEEAQYGLV